MKCMINKSIPVLIAAILLCLTACSSNTSDKSTSSENVLVKPVDTIFVYVDANSNMKVGEKSITVENLQKTLLDSVNSLKKSGATKIPEFKLIVKGEGMLMGARAEINDIFEAVKGEIQK
jgi:hypothetical protein